MLAGRDVGAVLLEPARAHDDRGLARGDGVADFHPGHLLREDRVGRLDGARLAEPRGRSLVPSALGEEPNRQLNEEWHGEPPAQRRLAPRFQRVDGVPSFFSSEICPP